jgi:hypothetical protein
MKVIQYIGEAHGALPAIPSTGAYESALEKAAAGMNEITKGLQAIGKVGEDIYKRHKETKRENDLQRMQIETEKDWLTFKTGYDRSNPDPMNYAKDIEKSWDEIVKKRSGMTKDGETSRVFKDRTSARKLMILSQGHAEAERRFHDQYFAESISNVDEWANLSANAESLEDATIFQNDMLGEINKGYPFTEKYAGELETSKLNYIKTQRAKNAEGRVYQDILRDPGGTMQKLMLPPEAGQYPDITEPTKRETLRVHAQNVFKVKETERLQEETRIKIENHDKEELEIGSLYATGKLKIDDIQKSKFLSGDERFTWTVRIEAKQRAGIVIKTNFGTYAKIQDMIYLGQPKAKIVKTISLASEKDLSEQDAENLLNKAQAYEGSLNDQYVHRSYDFLRDRYMKPDLANPGAFIEKFMGGNEKYYRNLNVLDIEIQKAKQSGKPLQGAAIFDKAQEIAGKPSIQDYITKPPSPKKPNVPQKKENESIEDYLKRTGGGGI